MVVYQNSVHGSKAILLFSKNIVSRSIMIDATIYGLAELDQAQLERKIRLLSFASLGFAHVGHDLSYSEVASVLQIELSQVEKWAIDGMSS